MSPRLGLVLLLGVCLGMSALRGDFACETIGRKRVEISFWNGFTGPDGRVMLELIRDFNRENPDIEVTMQRIPWALYYNKVMVSGLDGRGPEVFVIHASAMTRMHRAGVIAPMDSLYSESLPIADFDPYVMDQMKFGESRYGVPLDIHPQGMFLNADLLKANGFANPDGSARAPKTKAEFLQVASKLMSKDQFGFALTAWHNNFMSLLPQFDGRYLDEKGNADLNCTGNIEALTFLGELRGKLKLIPPPDNQLGWVGYRQKKVGMVWDGIYMLGDLLRLEGMNYLGAPIPVIGRHSGTLADSHTLCFRPGLNEDQRKASEKFVAYLSESSLRWAAAGQVPARKSVRALPEFQKMQVQAAFAEQIPTMMYMPRIPVLFEMGLEIQLAVEKVVRGRATPKEALDLADANTQKVLDRDRAQHQSEEVVQ